MPYAPTPGRSLQHPGMFKEINKYFSFYIKNSDVLTVIIVTNYVANQVHNGEMNGKTIDGFRNAN